MSGLVLKLAPKERILIPVGVQVVQLASQECRGQLQLIGLRLSTQRKFPGAANLRVGIRSGVGLDAPGEVAGHAEQEWVVHQPGNFLATIQ